ncbi:MAG: D-sedoheptulose 7-phosphate isomerase [Elusimicrobiaceae bacterium]|nr:D-sedoheptulose 7-phosphate isomerase [Elusimicrobiaceae bacterium]
MFVQNQADELIAAISYVKENLADKVEELAAQVLKAFQAGHKVILMGNGGSAGDAQHIAAEFVGRFKKERPSLPALALNTNTSTLTAIGNDYSYDVVFSRQIDGFAQKGDVVIGISTSGNSKNVYLALALAKRKGCFTAAFLGKDGGTIKDICDLPLVVAVNNTPHVQACHIFMGHCMCELVDQAY